MSEETPKRYFPPLPPLPGSTPIQRFPTQQRTSVGGLQMMPSYPPAPHERTSLFGQRPIFNPRVNDAKDGFFAAFPANKNSPAAGLGTNPPGSASSTPEYSGERPIFTPRVNDAKDGSFAAFPRKKNSSAVGNPPSDASSQTSAGATNSAQRDIEKR